MALYAYTTLDVVPDGLTQMAAGTAVCVPFTLVAGQKLAIDLVHTPSLTAQDFSIRGWVSQTMLGNPDPALPQFVQTWQPMKASSLMVILFYDRATSADGLYLIPADPGQYVLNILNLTNTPNQFSLTITDVTATGETPS